VKYISTRGQAPALAFDDVLLTGLARDGGLYVPQSWPRLTPDDLRALRGKSYAEVAAIVMRPFIAGSVAADAFDAIVADSYAGFAHTAVTPLKQLDGQLWLLELFHGPTLAFKDVALQLVGRLFDHVLSARNERVTIVGATSGDTGSAAIEACRDRDRIDIVILHPQGRTSAVQRRQMTTVLSGNVHNVALQGTFDDCQDAVKSLFNDTAYRDELRLSAVNSINWARIMAQIAYYVAAAVALGAPDRPVAFSVPTGNFGNVYAAYGARAMGVPIERLVVGTNANDILARFFASGTMQTSGVHPTISPSMDIQISSNFERLLFDLLDRDGSAVSRTMADFRQSGHFTVTPAQLDEARRLFSGHRCGEAETMATMSRVHAETAELIDPHTAVGLAAAAAALAAGEIPAGVPVVALACAHPAKFPDAVEGATGLRPALPPHLHDLFEREERVTVLPNDMVALKEFVRARSRVTVGDQA
jgi:threonine synthase